MKSDFKIGDIVEVIPECLNEIDYTNKPNIGEKYIIRYEGCGDIWSFGLNHLSGQNANIYISWKHIRKTNN